MVLAKIWGVSLVSDERADRYIEHVYEAAMRISSLEGSVGELTQLFQNLPENAIKFRKRKILPRVKVSGRLWWQEVKRRRN